LSKFDTFYYNILLLKEEEEICWSEEKFNLW
jgi:hypothetical protein